LLSGIPEPNGAPTPAELDQLFGRGVLRLWHGELAAARDDLSRVARATRRRGPIHSQLYAAQYLADAAYHAGRWDEAIVTAEDGAAIARDLGNVWALPMLHAVASYPHAQRGNFAAAAAHLDQAEAAIATDVDIPNRLWTALGRARLATARWNFSGAIAALEAIAAIGHLDGVREPGVQSWQPVFAAALIDVGNLERASAVIDTAAAVARTRGHLCAMVALERERARLVAENDLEQGLEIAAKAAENVAVLAGSPSGRPFDVASFELVHGRLLIRAGRQDDAATALRRAQELFSGLGAMPWEAATSAELDRIGAAGAAARHAPGQLTAHERRVARLVASGMTNKQVAAELIISTRTVGYHLENVYVKLGVHSRVQMTNLLNEHLDGPVEATGVSRTK
ncbi:MAG TPA: helix-turn-helix transcriptional regulator, partial [Acidimicrobiales bacterium]|nr:helix-turn-helix transcriptional regulator [Acidimicrobiales bacterium]